MKIIYDLLNQVDFVYMIYFSKRNTKANAVLAQYMPFYNCSDYWIQREYLSNTEKFLKTFENNTFTTECRKFIEGLTRENYSCKYYNENKYNSMLSKHPIKK